jgi:hypothetical protein
MQRRCTRTPDLPTEDLEEVQGAIVEVPRCISTAVVPRNGVHMMAKLPHQLGDTGNDSPLRVRRLIRCRGGASRLA